MKTWQDFLNSLSTRGGAILILMILSLVGFGITLHIIHHTEDGNMMFAAGLITTVGNFTGALLLALKGSSENTSTATVGADGATTVRVSDRVAATAAPDPPKPPVQT